VAVAEDKVLLLRVSVVALPTSVSVEVGRVNVADPLLVLIDAMVGVVMVGLVANTTDPEPVVADICVPLI
jgi:hypothetical protein